MEINWATPLYEFLRRCETSPLSKKILDCGAGGDSPPLSIFYQMDYKTCGIEIDPRSLAQAREFCYRTGMSLNILRGDMRSLPFPSAEFSFVYSFNAIFFMKKSDILQVMLEMERVLKPSGLCFVNFLSVDEPNRNEYNEQGRMLFGTSGFSYHVDDEPDGYFNNFVLLMKEKRWTEQNLDGKKNIQVSMEYMARKK